MNVNRNLRVTRPVFGLALGLLVVSGCVRHLRLQSRLVAETNLVVAADGSGQFKTVQEAMMAVPAGSSTNPVVIHIKPGTYNELIYVQREKRFFHLVGEDPEKTVLTYNLNANIIGQDGKPIGTFRTPSTQIDADDFTAENLTFENSAGPVGQALAIRLDGDREVFRNCRFLGWQDTILANRGRHYFEACYIAGHVDFIFGAATVFFEKCHVHCLGNGYITAASTPDDQPFGYVFSNCKITGASPEVKTYLGRPWRACSAVTFLNTEMSEVVRPVGWNNWNDPAKEKTARYAEFNSTGPGANPAARVPWARQLTGAEAKAITMEKVLAGADGWNPNAGPARSASAPVQTGQGHRFVCTDYTQGKVFIVSEEGRAEWEYPAPNGNDVWALPNGNLLFNTGHGVKEVTRDKQVVFDYESKSEIYACQRLANGNTFIGECNAGRLLEVAPDGRIVKEIRLLPEGKVGGSAYMRNARRLENGNYLVAHYDGEVVREYDPQGKVVMEIPAAGGPHSVARLPNGNTLIACADRKGGPRVFEVDKTGKTVWQVQDGDLPGISLKFMTGFQRLPNGNTVMSNWLGHGQFGQAPHVIEITPDKKVVWTYADHHTMRTISSLQLLDVPGDVTQGGIWH